jgi:hypothetical protein
MIVVVMMMMVVVMMAGMIMGLAGFMCQSNSWAKGKAS